MTCYLCHHKKTELCFQKLGYDVYYCPKCTLYFLDFGNDYDKFIKKYYQEGFFKGDKIFRAYADYEGDKPIELRNMARYLRHILKYKNSGRLLDAGCALGFLLEIAQKKGFEVSGLDVSTYAVKIARKKFGKWIYYSSLSKAKLPHKYFDAITLFDLIEHLKKPREDLRNLRNSLKNDGLLIIQTGDAGSAWARILGKNWHFYAPPQHLFFFNQKTITQLLTQAGFEVLKIEKHGKWVSLRYLFHMMRYIQKQSIGDFLYSKVSNNKMGKFPLYLKFYDNMIVYAKKN